MMITDAVGQSRSNMIESTSGCCRWHWQWTTFGETLNSPYVTRVITLYSLRVSLRSMPCFATSLHVLASCMQYAGLLSINA